MTVQRFRSLTEIEKYPNSDIVIPLFDKESSDFCFEKSREILSKPLNIDLPAAFNSKHFDKKTRDLIGENLLEIENTLKALNLDFLQTYNDLEKTDSAETLFGENYNSYENSPKLQNSKITKLFDMNYGGIISGSGGGVGGTGIVSNNNVNTSGSCVDKTLSEITQAALKNKPSDFLIDIPRKLDSTPEFSPKETSISSRRSSQKSNYSPQETNFSPREINFQSSHDRVLMNYKNDFLHDVSPSSRNLTSSPIRNVNTSNNSIHSGSQIHYNNNRRSEENCSPSNRQRSMSFTENYDLKSPVLSEPQVLPAAKVKYTDSRFDNEMSYSKARNVIMYKPKSIRARNLRRLSYNPIFLESSSSSSSENEFDRSIAHSECDIRSKMTTSRRRRPYRKTNQSSQDKLYGSNASIKSAPQYNYASDRLPQQFQENQNLRYSYGNDKNYEQASRLLKANYPNNKILQQNFQLNNPLIPFDREMLYSEFDVTKLTGKSPTTHSYLNQFQQPNLKPPLSADTITPNTGFRWPEKIHASTVKQNDLLWRRGVKYGSQQTVYPEINFKQDFSSDTSSTETDSIDFRRDFVPRMPPSPAP